MEQIKRRVFLFSDISFGDSFRFYGSENRMRYKKYFGSRAIGENGKKILVASKDIVVLVKGLE